MQQIGKSSLWVEKYRPVTINDLILPDHLKKFFQQMVEEKEISNILLAGTAGRGKCLDYNTEIEIFVSEENYNKYFKS